MTDAPDANADKDLPLREDTRLLGRLLGDVLRAQTGEEGFARIEAIRQTAIRFRRAGPDDAAAVKRELDALLYGLPIGQTLDVVRAFSYFSHLANIAEDVHQNRRRRMHALAGSTPQRGSLADALDCVAAHGVDGRTVTEWFAHALVSPVLTAHPTEVQRKSILDCEREIARLLQWRDRVRLTPDEAVDFETGLYRQVLALWQTAMIRLAKLKVRDEIDNGLAYYRYTFLAEVPRLYLALEARLRARFGAGGALAPFLRLGSWIGGDRDGNPFVVAETLRYAISAQAAVAFAHYLDEIHALGGELSLSTRLVQPTPALLALAAKARDANPHRADEPYRQALIGVYARVAATAQALAGYVAAARAARGAAALRDAGRAPRRPRDDRRIARAARRVAARRRASRAADPRRRRVRLPSRGARPAAERRRARSGRRRTARACRRARRLCGACRKASASSLLTRELASPRLLHSPHLAYSERARSELAILGVAADIHRRYGAAALPNYVISKCQSVSDLLEVGDPAEGGRAAARRRRSPSTSCRCSRRSTTSSARRDDHARRVRAAALPRAGSTAAAARRK